ncbi:MAG TPA: alpha/beta hydrolase [Ramlibacter sp.]|jgi:triacylglycerol lipase
MRALSALLALLLAACAAPSHISGGAVPSQVPAHISANLHQLGRVVAPPQTAALYAPLQQREPYAGVQVARGERYAGDARHLLDVFTATAGGSAARPVLVFVHGGAFVAGDRRTGDSPFYDNIMLWAVKNGMVGVNMTYRLAPQHPWPAAQQDIGAALGWVRQNIAARGGDPQRIFLMGHSAGAAHVAQYLAHPQFHATPGSGVVGAILVSALFDPASAEQSPSLQAYFGSDASLYRQRSAVPGLVASTVPLLLAYAELDPEYFHRQSELTHAALCRRGHCPPLLKLMGHSHMSEVYAINTADTSLTHPLRDFVRGRR